MYKRYIVLEKNSSIEYGMTDKLWLVKLFILQRNYYCETKRKFIVKTQNCKQKTLYGFKLNPLFIHYNSGFAITNREQEFLDYRLNDNITANYSKIKKKKKNFKKYLRETEKMLLLMIIKNSPEVEETLREKQFFDNIF